MRDDTTAGAEGQGLPVELELGPQDTTDQQPTPAPDDTASQAEDRESTEYAVVHFGRLIRDGAGVEEHLKDVLERDLGAEPTPNSFGSLGRRLAEYLGEDLTSWLFLFLTTEDATQILGWAEEVRGVDNQPQVLDFLRWLRAIYGQAVSDAYSSWQEPANAWMRLNRRVYFDQLVQTWIVDVEIAKYNGDVMTVSGSPSSMLQLTRYVLATLNTLPDPAPFLPQQLEQFLAELETFRAKFPPDSTTAAPLEVQAAPSSEPAPEVSGAPGRSTGRAGR